MELQGTGCAKDRPAGGEDPLVAFDEQLQELISKDSLDFNTWTSIISMVEKMYPDNIEKVCSCYDSFLSEFPLCHGYWRKYAAYSAHLCTVDKVDEIFKRAVQSATYCVGVWVDYCSFSMSAYEDPSDVRRLFKKALSCVGKDYLCHPLWDKYLEFEFSQQKWIFLAQIYVQILKFPKKKLHHYYDNFKKFAAILEEEMKQHKNCSIEIESEPVSDVVATTIKDELFCAINNMLDPSTGFFSYKALQKYVSVGERFYQGACEMERKIQHFETNIQRTNFDVIPLDDDQLKNWHCYLDFIEMQEDFDWAVKLYERCLIPCAGYPEFWMRYVEFVETKGGRELANFALERATKIFLKKVPEIHLFNARFKEQIGDKHGARAAFPQSDNEFGPYFIEKVVKEANMEIRWGNFGAASSVYEKALEMAAARQKLHCVPILYIHFSRLKYKMTGSVDAARDVIIDGIGRVPHCKLLIEGLINFLMMHGELGQVNVVDAIIADALSPGSDASQGLSAKDCEDLSVLYLQFVDQCGTVHDIRKAWNRHMKLFPHLIRTASQYMPPTLGNQLLDTLMEGRQDNPSLKSDQLSGGKNLQMQEQRSSFPETHAIPEEVLTDQFHTEDEDNSALDRLQQLSPKVAEQSMEDASGVNKSTCDFVHQSEEDESGQMDSTPHLVHQSGEDALGPVESTHGLEQSDEDAFGPMLSTHGLEHQSGDDACDPMDLTQGLVNQPREAASGPIEPTHDLVHRVADGDALSDASQGCSDSINVQQEHEPEQNLELHEQDREPEQNLGLPSLDGLSLISQEEEYGGSIPVSSYEHKALTSNRIPENSPNTNGSSSIVSPVSPQSADSAQIQNESVNPSSLARHQNPLLGQEHPQPQVPADIASNWHQSQNKVPVSEDARSGFHGDLQDPQDQQWNVSAQQLCPVERGAQILTSQGYAHHPLSGQSPQVQQGMHAQNQDPVGTAQGNSTATNSWPTQNLQQQSFVSIHQLQSSPLPASHTQPQIHQFSMQSGGQFGYAPYSQASYSQAPYSQVYNQNMENYLLQQQQMIVQQHYEQQQQFVQQLQQQVQQPYQQQQHLLQSYQQQQQLAQLYYNQLPQLQEQQAQLMQQQQQQLLYAHQQQDQIYHQFMHLQQQQYGYQQHHPMQQQQGYQQLQQQQKEEEQQQLQRQITSIQFPTANRSFCQQGQQVMPPNSASSSRTVESPHPQQQQSQSTTPLHGEAASGSAVSPHHQKQSPHGVTPPHSAGASGPAT